MFVHCKNLRDRASGPYARPSRRGVAPSGAAFRLLCHRSNTCKAGETPQQCEEPHTGSARPRPRTRRGPHRRTPDPSASDHRRIASRPAPRLPQRPARRADRRQTRSSRDRAAGRRATGPATRTAATTLDSTSPSSNRSWSGTTRRSHRAQCELPGCCPGFVGLTGAPSFWRKTTKAPARSRSRHLPLDCRKHDAAPRDGRGTLDECALHVAHGQRMRHRRLGHVETLWHG